jgi:hypothetical protein
MVAETASMLPSSSPMSLSLAVLSFLQQILFPSTPMILLTDPLSHIILLIDICVHKYKFHDSKAQGDVEMPVCTDAGIQVQNISAVQHPFGSIQLILSEPLKVHLYPLSTTALPDPLQILSDSTHEMHPDIHQLT